MNLLTRKLAAAALFAAPALTLSTPVEAGVGDLLVAPTRIILDGGKGAEIVLNNIGDEPATYRISTEFRRMAPTALSRKCRSHPTKKRRQPT
jgi:P pilus assembly chaperone PapD